MTGWGRLRGALVAVGLAAALSGCGQLFTEGRQPATLTQLSSRVDAIDAQVGEIQATLAGGGSATAAGQSGSGELQPGMQSAVVVADVLNVRTDPSLQGTVKGTLLQNARVNIVSVDGNWTEITFINPSTQKTLTGWVDSDYLGPNPDAGGAAATSGTSASPAPAGSATGTQASASSATQNQPAAAQPASATADSAALSGAY